MTSPADGRRVLLLGTDVADVAACVGHPDGQALACRQCDGLHTHRWVRVELPPTSVPGQAAEVLEQTGWPGSMPRRAFRCVSFGCWPCTHIGCVLRLHHLEEHHDDGAGDYPPAQHRR